MIEQQVRLILSIQKKTGGINIYDIIIGGGPAGYTSALYAARAGLETLVIERMSAGGHMTLTGDIDNYPEFDEGVDGFVLGMKMQKGAEQFGSKIKYAEVTSVDFSEKVKTLETTNGTFYAKTVLFAAGAFHSSHCTEGFVVIFSP